MAIELSLLCDSSDGSLDLPFITQYEQQYINQ